MLGIIFTRHVNCEKSNRYWNECYRCIRQYYPTNLIMIIDDNSDYQYIKTETELTNVFIVQSEYPKCGELLSYYYFYKYKLFDRALVIHDTVYINTYINCDLVDTVKFLWHFTHGSNDTDNELGLLEYLNHKDELIELYKDQSRWHGTFGVQSIITYDFLSRIQDKYNLFNLVTVINTRYKRCNMERIFALLCCAEDKSIIENPSLLGIIHNYLPFYEFFFENYIMYKNQIRHLPLIKVWAMR